MKSTESSLILVVDDNKSNLRILAKILKDESYQIALANNGNEALNLINKRVPDLILLDIMMPKLDGYKVCQILKEDDSKAEIPIIFISGLNDLKDKLKAFKLGGVDYITKPFQKEEVLARVKTHIELKKAKEELKSKNELLFRLNEEKKLLLDNVDLQIWYLKNEKTYGGVNKARAEFLGLTKEEGKNKNICELMNKEEAERCIASNLKVYHKKDKIISEEKATNHLGEERILEIIKIPKFNSDGKIEFIVCYAKDITEERKKEEKIEYLTFHDQLTGLYNRSYFKQELKRYDTERQLPLTVIVGDVNGLKLVNDAFGHQVGDNLLILVSQILKSVCRDEDLIARWGGDEFVILLPKVDLKIAEKICCRIKNKTKQEYVDGIIQPSISLGYASKVDSKQEYKDVFDKADERMYQDKFANKKETQNRIMRSLIKKLESESSEDEEHLMWMQKISFQFGEALGLSLYELEKLSLLATLHDIGKISVAEDILTKNDSLNNKEWEEVKKHSIVGYRITSATEEFAHISNYILHHHEHWDGGGYPEGLKKNEIPFLSRVISIVDAYVVMKNGRPYQKKMNEEEIKNELIDEAGNQFDPALVEEFLKFSC